MTKTIGYDGNNADDDLASARLEISLHTPITIAATYLALHCIESVGYILLSSKKFNFGESVPSDISSIVHIQL